MKNKELKAMGRIAAHLVAALYSRNRPLFHFQEAQEILGGRASTSKALGQLVRHGIATRLKSGVFRLVPFELGFEREYLGNPYLVARELASVGRTSRRAYYISHASAFDLHQMVTQPSLVMYVSTPALIRPKIIQGTEFHFVRCRYEEFFGITEMWVDKSEKISISDLERTLIDGLKLPGYCGGMTEVTKAFSIKKELIDPQKIVDYAIKLGVGAVIRRLGYLMELYEIGSRSHLEHLLTLLTDSYQRFDPDLPSEGHHTAKWRLRLNISEEELIALGGT